MLHVCVGECLIVFQPTLNRHAAQSYQPPLNPRPTGLADGFAGWTGHVQEPDKLGVEKTMIERFQIPKQNQWRIGIARVNLPVLRRLGRPRKMGRIGTSHTLRALQRGMRADISPEMASRCTQTASAFRQIHSSPVPRRGRVMAAMDFPDLMSNRNERFPIPSNHGLGTRTYSALRMASSCPCGPDTHACG